MSTVKSKKLQVGTDATSSNNFTIYQPATPDGTLRIGVGNADSPTEVGRFTSAGYKPATAPMFSARIDTTHSISSTTWTKVQFDTEEFDTHNCYDPSTYTFIPNVAGYYQINVNVRAGSGGTTQDGEQLLLAIRKSGTLRITHAGNTGGVNDCNWTGSQLLYANGTTDYFDIYFYSSNGININSSHSHFSAFLVQQA